MHHRSATFRVFTYATILVFFLTLVNGCTSYQPSEKNAPYLVSSTDVTVTQTANQIIFEPTQPYTNAIAFYPGGKVNFTAYAELLYSLAEHGIYCVTWHMPLDYAFTGIHKVHAAIEARPDLNWYLAGHSLGGAMAAVCAGDADPLTGLIMLAAYSTKDLSETNLRVLTIYGSNDQVLNLKKVRECAANLPADSTTVVIEGGNHAQFGNYGFQKGDGVADITVEEQLEQTIKAILQLMR